MYKKIIFNVLILFGIIMLILSIEDERYSAIIEKKEKENNSFLIEQINEIFVLQLQVENLENKISNLEEKLKEYENTEEFIEGNIDLYYSLTEEEWDCLYRVARAEAGPSAEGQKNVVHVVLNRVYSDKFREIDIVSVVFADNQFAVVSNGSYHSVEITDEIKDNVEDAVLSYVEGESAEGALFFCSGDVHFGARQYLFTDEAGHRFYK